MGTQKAAPWRNVLTHNKIEEIVSRLEKSNLDPHSKIICGSKEPLNENWKGSLLICGSDATAHLHLGHLALLLVALIFRKHIKGNIIISINEIESLLSRDIDLSQILSNRIKIKSFLKNIGFNNIHSRMQDSDVGILSTYLWKKICAGSIPIAINNFYDAKLSYFDVFSVSIMAVTPAVVGVKNNNNKVVLLYSKDEIFHLEFIRSLYNTPWYRKLIARYFNIDTDINLNYVVINPLPSISGLRKMSKTDPGDAIFIDYARKITCPTHILSYLSYLLNMAEKNGLKKSELYSLLFRCVRGDKNEETVL